MIRFLILTFLFTSIDLLSKYYVNFYLEKEIIITDYFKIALSKNENLAFSIPMPGFLQIILSFLLLGFLGFYLYKIKPLDNYYFIGGILIFGGALGNLYERIFYKAVTDFIDFSFWPSFNFADSFIVSGVTLIILSDFLHKKAEEQE